MDKAMRAVLGLVLLVLGLAGCAELHAAATPVTSAQSECERSGGIWRDSQCERSIGGGGGY